MNALPIVIPTRGPPQVAGSGAIPLRTERTFRLWPDPSTPPCSARGDKVNDPSSTIRQIARNSVTVGRGARQRSRMG